MRPLHPSALVLMLSNRVIMGANIAGIYGAQIFRADDKPLYRRGFGIDIAVLAVGVTLAVVRYSDGWIQKLRASKQGQLANVDSGSEHNSQEDEKSSLPRTQPGNGQALGYDTKAVPNATTH